MKLRVAELTGEAEGHYVLYPSPAPPSGPRWLVVYKWDGAAVADSEYAPSSVLPYVLERLRKAADAAVERGEGEPLEARLEVLGSSARAWAEELGWLARYRSCAGEFILPHTPVFFPDGVPAGLREQARGNLKKALRLLADEVRYWHADPAEVFESLPQWGEVVTAAELAAS